MAPRDDDKVMAGILRRTLASSSGSEAATPGNDCPAADALAAYYERSLGDDESARYELHFSQCARCREQLAAMVRADDLPQPKTNWAWLWNPYMLAPAVAVLALAVFFGIHRRTPTATVNQQSNAPLVAMSRADQPSSRDQATPQPAAPIADPRNTGSGQLQTAPSNSAEFDSLAKQKQLAAPTASGPSTAPVVRTEPSPVANTLSDKKVQDLPLNRPNVIQLQSVEKSANAPQNAVAPAPPGLADNSDLPLNGRSVVQPQKSADAAGHPQTAAAPHSASQTVQVTAATASAQLSQNEVPSKKEPLPSAPAGAGTLAGVVPSVGSNTTAETVNRSQTQAPAAMSRFATAAKSPSPKVAAEISTQKVFQTPNTTVLWRSADGGFVERSADGGATWQGQSLPGTSGEIDAGSSPTPKICWLVGSSGIIFMTKDATNWKKIVPPVPADFSAVTAKDASNATVTAADGRKFQTSDGGNHWKLLR